MAEKWKTQNPEYGKYQTKYQRELRDLLKSRFDRYAIISQWNFQEPNLCKFSIESHRTEGNKILDAIDKSIRENLFIPEDFDEFILIAAEKNEPLGKLLKELREPRPGEKECIPWLGETLIKERITRLCSQGKIAINLRGIEYLQLNDGEKQDDANLRMRGKIGTGKFLDETHLLLPQNVPATGGLPQYDAPVSLIDQPGVDEGLGLGGQDESRKDGESKSSATLDNIEGYTSLTTQPLSSLNLLGIVENWGISKKTQIRSLVIRVNELTGAQLENLIKSLPDEITYRLELEKGDNK